MPQIPEAQTPPGLPTPINVGLVNPSARRKSEMVGKAEAETGCAIKLESSVIAFEMYMVFQLVKALGKQRPPPILSKSPIEAEIGPDKFAGLVIRCKEIQTEHHASKRNKTTVKERVFEVGAYPDWNVIYA